MAVNRKVIDQVNDAFSRGDVAAFLDCCTEDVQWVMAGDDTIQGREAVRQWLESMEGEPPRFLIEDSIEAGDRVVVWGQMTMDEDDEQGYAFCDIYRLRDGKVAELRSFVVYAGEDEDEEEYEEEFEEDD
ncbi:MAG: nuclear transport factor 2 family protein [Gammaproteobacteria bacterium]|jgi:ketosteroid isomerase-like protein|nr:nuclear transport factor 2 family protein [Gammaproteobacteria bacterium]